MGRVAWFLWLLGLSQTAGASSAEIRLLDRTEAAGFTVVTYCGGEQKNHILESTGNGVLLFDYDGDGLVDVYFVNAHRLPGDGVNEPHSSVLYRNEGDGRFRDVTEAAGVETRLFGQGGAVGDVDADGLADFYVTGFGGNLLFRNNGDGTFSDWTDRSGTGSSGWTIGASFFDADGDGDQDLYTARYLEASWEEVHQARRTRRWRGKVSVLDGPKGLPGAANRFFRNRGDGSFTDATEAAGLTEAAAHYSMGTVPFDYDRDGDVDLYVANDSTPNALYQNDGRGRFQEVGVSTGLAYGADGQTQGSMGVEAGDFDGDGFFDLVVTNFAHDYYTLYRNLGGLLFQDDSFSAGLAVTTFAPLGWGVLLVDVDLDSDLDIFFSNGQIYPQVDEDPSLGETYRQPNQLLLNENGKFVATTTENLSLARSSRGAAAGDLDNDGDLDILVSNQDDRPTYLENGSQVSGHWLRLTLVGESAERMALGARVAIQTSGGRQIRQVSSGGSYASESDRRLHFGLGAAASVDRLEVRWPDGTSDVHRKVEANTSYVIKQGQPPLPLAGRP